MELSLNEVQKLVEKAALGAGAPAGIDNDLGEMAAWLAARDLLQVEQLLTDLRAIETECFQLDRIGKSAIGQFLSWPGELGPLLSIILGDLYLSQRSQNPEASLEVEARVLKPAYFIALFARRRILGDLHLTWQSETAQGAAAWQDGELLGLTGEETLWKSSKLLLSGADTPLPLLELPTLELPAAELETRRSATLRQGVPLDEDQAMALGELAHRTLVPASEASRQKGAGAGTSDND